LRPQLRNLPKKDIVFLDEHFCKHGHRYINHYNCYLLDKEEQGLTPTITERIGYLDIEASNLKADFGIVYCYCIKDSKSKIIYYRTVTPKEFAADLDKNCVAQCIEDMKKFDRIVTWYGSRFDLPFIRSRAIAHRLQFPLPKTIWQTDGWRIARDKLAISSNRLKSVSKLALGKTQKTEIENEYWLRALQGDKNAMSYILDHCKKDVLDLEKVYNIIGQYAPRSKTSV
jgi:uncharacterized protein YprB with RNaseH-like and TPR domain